MDACSRSAPLSRQPGSARVWIVDDRSGSAGEVNPDPLCAASLEPVEAAVECFTPTHLQALTGQENLQEVSTLEMCVDTRESSLGNFGAHLPGLLHLKLNNSTISCIRDLGGSLRHLQVLWMCRCSLVDLHGLSSLPSLRELYIAYNGAHELGPLSLLEELEVLDLEGNGVEDMAQVHALALCPHLACLTLEGNPVCSRASPNAPQDPSYEYRRAVLDLLPQLSVLDDRPANERHALPAAATTGTDWLLVRDAIVDDATTLCLGHGLGGRESPVSPLGRPGTARPRSARPRSACASLLWGNEGGPTRPRTAILQDSVGSRPQTPASRVSSPHSDDASDLTHGGSGVICGNPVKALRARRNKLNTTSSEAVSKQETAEPSSRDGTRSPGDSATMAGALPALCHIPDPPDSRPSPLCAFEQDVLLALSAWREEFSRNMKTFAQKHEPQVLSITYGGDVKRSSSRSNRSSIGEAEGDQQDSVSGEDSVSEGGSDRGVSPAPLCPLGGSDLSPTSSLAARVSVGTSKFPSPPTLHRHPRLPPNRQLVALRMPGARRSFSRDASIPNAALYAKNAPSATGRVTVSDKCRVTSTTQAGAAFPRTPQPQSLSALPLQPATSPPAKQFGVVVPRHTGEPLTLVDSGTRSTHTIRSLSSVYTPLAAVRGMHRPVVRGGGQESRGDTRVRTGDPPHPPGQRVFRLGGARLTPLLPSKAQLPTGH
nr:leucine-rich repeat-containing protein 56 isoform X2 [Petromyzon marinus]